MHIQKLTIQNLKSFRGEHEFNFSAGLNYIVGDNNCGKSSVFEALLYLVSGKSFGEEFLSRGADAPTRVEVLMSGDDLASTLSEPKFQKYESYLYESDGQKFLRVERSAEEREVLQAGKAVKLDGKKACFWHEGRQQFENPTGIDALFRALIDLEPIWADTDPADLTDFSSTKTLGKLVDTATSEFVGTEEWEEFSAAHKKAFATEGAGSLREKTKTIAGEIEALVRDQYGPANVRFDFDLPEASAFFKKGRILVDDGAGETALGGKGSGMQRAFALAIIQLYARSTLQSTGEPKPLILLIDEPETWLHPTAQLKLADALAVIARSQQLFLITHSPYLLRKFDSMTHQLVVFQGKGDSRKITYSSAMGAIGAGSPTWGEINYHAFGICSYELHNELYGEVQRRLELGMSANAKEHEIDAHLVANNIAQTKTWNRSATKSHSSTLAAYIRNSIHHPENDLNPKPTEAELLQSTRDLLSVIAGQA